MSASMPSFEMTTSTESFTAARAAELKPKLAVLLTDTDEMIRQIKVPNVCDLTFTVEGIPFYARSTPISDKENRLDIWCTLGYLPFSVSSVEKRHALIYILESTRALNLVRFGVDKHLKIVATASFKLEAPTSPDYLYYPLIQFLQQARPYIRLIGSYL